MSLILVIKSTHPVMAAFVFVALKLASKEKKRKGRFLLYGLSLTPDSQVKKSAFKKYVNVAEEGKTVIQAFPVTVSKPAFSYFRVEIEQCVP